MRLISVRAYIFSILFHTLLIVIFVALNKSVQYSPVTVVDLTMMADEPYIQPAKNMHASAKRDPSPIEPESKPLAEAFQEKPKEENPPDTLSNEYGDTSELADASSTDSVQEMTPTVEKSVIKSRQDYIKGNFSYIEKRIASKLTYPDMARELNQQGTLFLSFTIMENGSVDDVKVIKSSGSRLLDDNAVITIKESAPYPKPPFPAEIHIPIAYNLE
jgi:periplasmic protein TonB